MPRSSAPPRKEIRDRVAAELVVPVVPRHEPRHLGQRRRAGYAQGSFHSGLCRPGQPARRVAALRTLGLAGHHHLRTRRNGDREAARLLLAQVPDPDPRRDDQGSLAGRLRQVRRPGDGAHAVDRTDRGAEKRDPGLPRQGLRPRQRRLEQEQAGRRADPRFASIARKPATRRPRPGSQTLTAQIGSSTSNSGGISQVSLKPDWSTPPRNSRCSPSRRRSPPMHAPRCSSAMRPIARPPITCSVLKNTLAAPGGGFYASMGEADGAPGVDKRQYARETRPGDPGRARLLRRHRASRR